MATKHTQNSYRLRNILVTILFTIIAILIIGILTRSPGTIEESEVEQTSSSQSEEVLIEIRDILKELEAMQKEQLDFVNQILENQKMARENKVEDVAEVEEISEILTGPALYASYVDQIIEQYYPILDADTIKAMIYLESTYRPNLVNKKTGVKGLMQVSPKWHTERAKSLGVTDLLDPYGNILVGCDILNEMTQKYGATYAINYYAGGYKYANNHKNSTSAYIKKLNGIKERMKNGEIVLGGE